jgi:hypothetical protein
MREPHTEKLMQIATQKRLAIESLVVDGEKDGTMQGYTPGERGFKPPFAIFSPDLQHNVGGPYASAKDALKAITLMRGGAMVPYTDDATVVWTVNGRPSEWYEKD